MRKEEITALFDKQASSYEQQLRHAVSSIPATSTRSRRMGHLMPPRHFWSRNSSWSARLDHNSSKASPNVLSQRVS